MIDLILNYPWLHGINFCRPNIPKFFVFCSFWPLTKGSSALVSRENLSDSLGRNPNKQAAGTPMAPLTPSCKTYSCLSLVKQINEGKQRHFLVSNFQNQPLALPFGYFSPCVSVILVFMFVFLLSSKDLCQNCFLNGSF